MVKVEGKCGISATIIADSINECGDRMVTYELVYPRFIHSELMTHRMLSKNAASSRAVPYATNIELVKESPAMPVHWGKNQPGMKANVELDKTIIDGLKGVWISALKSVISHTIVMNDSGLHKQVINRLLEPWTMMKTVISGTEWENFFWLRDHKDAQPEFAELARCANKAREKSVPIILYPGEWHLPYIATKREDSGLLSYWTDEYTEVTLEEAKTISVSCAAQVSYRKLDDTLEKAKKIFGMLNIGSTDKPCHASPLEHQCTPIELVQYNLNTNHPETWEPGVTHMDRACALWSGNLRGWIQYRQLIPGHVRW